MIAEATEALSRLDAAALEEVGHRAEALAALDLGSAGVSGAASVSVLEHRFRLFAALLKATGDNLATLRRAEGHQGPGAPYGNPRFADRPFDGPGLAAADVLPSNGSKTPRGLAPRGLFESFGLYSEEDAADSIWPRGRIAQARARRESSASNPPGGNRVGRA